MAAAEREQVWVIPATVTPKAERRRWLEGSDKPMEVVLGFFF